MPELPEVETIRRQLAPHVEGRTLTAVEVLDARWGAPRPPAEVAAGLAGRSVLGLARAGKYLIWELSDDRHLLMHLRMTGTLLFDPPADPPHTRVRVALSDGHRLVYLDPRRFGTGHLLESSQARDAYLACRLGPEPLTPQFTTAYLRRAARGRSAPVKSFVLDQRRIAGVGNIYADEALFRAGIHPLRATGSLRPAQLEALRIGIEDALAAGIEAKGATIDDFRHLDGAYGSFQDQFLVHRREGRPCTRCGMPVRKLVVGGRGTYVCERCQPRPRARSRPRRPTGASAGGAPPARSRAGQAVGAATTGGA
ncbi:MAG TPA: bifunctional DNA-formamidopyrimidine glycosylase/DNA-(apurinic or apyrimidinic site) lyase [Solirubrobacteraceae bacterium]|nr:bifunctional DNA-formamidopyrimidine glycosylase/DNA-(apurinic or apyrimidinic site) lyase [Solirubrobacteraceae bacterium]